ncbi:MAG: copper homeostasis protein CutC, partial [Erysipelotrichaceae bacterium]
MNLEIIVATVKDAISAQKLGATRLELCGALEEGGLTPSYGAIDAITSIVDIPVNVMLKTRSDYHFDDDDMAVILKDLEMIKRSNANGVVFGALTKDNRVDFDKLNLIIENKGHLKITHNRAIDRSVN